MDEIIPGLWIGDLQSAKNVEYLKAHRIFSILTAMRGRITIHETFIRHQIQLDDTQDADILTHFLPSIHFIQAELDKGRGVLVHCHAGISRSPTIVAAYLMYLKEIDPQTALELIRKARPFVHPNQNFFQQLELFHAARYLKASTQEKAIRMYYMGRTVEGVMNGDGSPPETQMFANYPRTTSDSLPNTPGASGPRRRIRCKMCRQELAMREHLLDHGQLGPATGSGESLSMSSTQEDLGKQISSPIPETPFPPQVRTPPRSAPAVPNSHPEAPSKTPATHLVGPSGLTGQPASSPELARSRSPPISVISAQVPVSRPSPISAPILANPKCSGYFLEPMKWMEHFLSSGEMAGKITCPNKKCNVKLGNFDWAGICCGCKEWVIPGFCVSRSKVDEVL